MMLSLGESHSDVILGQVLVDWKSLQTLLRMKGTVGKSSNKDICTQVMFFVGNILLVKNNMIHRQPCHHPLPLQDGEPCSATAFGYIVWWNSFLCKMYWKLIQFYRITWFIVTSSELERHLFFQHISKGIWIQPNTSHLPCLYQMDCNKNDSMAAYLICRIVRSDWIHNSRRVNHTCPYDNLSINVGIYMEAK